MLILSSSLMCFHCDFKLPLNFQTILLTLDIDFHLRIDLDINLDDDLLIDLKCDLNSGLQSPFCLAHSTLNLSETRDRALRFLLGK